MDNPGSTRESDTESVFGPPGSVSQVSYLSDNIGFYSQSEFSQLTSSEDEEESDYSESDTDDDHHIRQLDAYINGDDPRPRVHTIQAGGVTIKFPYKPYETQIGMATKLVQALQEGSNALLESPTGSGKTAVILCAVIAWYEKIKADDRIRRELAFLRARAEADGRNRVEQIVPSSRTSDDVNGNGTTDSTMDAPTQPMAIAAETLDNIPATSRYPKIIYATRTQGQAKQVLKQLRNTHYDSTLTAVLGSRKFSCINEIAKDPRSHFEDLREHINVEDACSKMRETSFQENGYPSVREPQNPAIDNLNWPSCKYFRCGKKPIPENCKTNGRPLDIEDMVLLGRRHSFCPYYALRDQNRTSELTICTHKHLLNPFVRHWSELWLKNAVVIFDEAHNLEASCREEASTKISGSLLENIKDELRKYQEEHVIPESKIQDWHLITNAVDRLSNWIALHRRLDVGFVPLQNSTLLAKDITTSFISTIEVLGWSKLEVAALEKANFDLLQIKRELNPDLPPERQRSLFAPPSKILRAFGRIVSTIKYLHEPGDLRGRRRYQDYYITVKKESRAGSNRADNKVELNFKCLNPAVTFKEISDQARNVILSSGTLSPLESFATELGVNFQIKESFPHVVPPERIMSALISRYRTEGPNLRLSSPNWNSVEIANDLAHLIVDTCIRIPNGVLVFFTSRNQLLAFKSLWDRTDFTHRLNLANKIVFYETDYRSSTQFTDLIRDYKEQARSVGAILFAIMRGRASEGVDYKDEEARAVISLGIPLAPFQDEVIQAKMAYNDAVRWLDFNYLGGRQWYNLEAQRALNQALGRCVRHVKDWGLIVIVDSRFCQEESWDGEQNRAGLPQWILASENSLGTESFQRLLPEIYDFVSRLGDRRVQDED